MLSQKTFALDAAAADGDRGILVSAQNLERISNNNNNNIASQHEV
jgi:hypothetical protein